MDFLAEYGMFFAKFMTILIVLVIIIGGVFIITIRSKSEAEGHLDIKNLNQKFENMNLLLKSQILPKKEFKKSIKALKEEHKKKDKSDEVRKRIFVLDFKGDIKASDVSSLREEISAILTFASKNDEIFVTLESAGGTVHGYGLAASQLKRIHDKNIKLIVAVDKVAASGGYMMACVADKIIAAPFAIIGSIGVLAQIPNFYRLLKKHNVDFEQVTAGQYKRTLTLFGENTDEDREKVQEELEETHQLFKDFIKEYRDDVDIDKIATGEHWYGKQAIELKLVDELKTSDDYLSEAVQNADIYEIDYIRKKPLSEKIISFGAKLLDSITYR
jgi:serine protease SohB